MASNQPKPQEIAETLLFADNIRLPFTLQGPHGLIQVSVDPSQDLIFNSNDKSFYVYRHGLWEVVPSEDAIAGPLARSIHAAIAENFPDVSITDQKIKEVHHSLIRLTNVKNYVNIEVPPPYLVFKNGTLDLRTLSLLPHDRRYRAIFGLDFDWSDTDIPTPVWDDYLATSLPDVDSRTLLQEAIGFYLTPFDEEPACFYLFGRQRTGKSRIFNFLYSLFGQKFSTTFSLQALTENDCNVAALVGKFINLQDEEESERISSDKLKSLLDHSPIQARRLYEGPFQFRPFTKFLFCANQLPNFKQIEGISRRVRFIHFEHQIPVELQDKDLDRKLMLEAPGIIRKCLQSFQRVRERNFEFTEPESSKDLMEDFLESVQPVRVFLDEMCTILDPNSPKSDWISNGNLYRSYDGWGSNNGYKRLNLLNFHKQISSLPGVETYVHGSTRWKNIRLKNPGEDVPTSFVTPIPF